MKKKMKGKTMLVPLSDSSTLATVRVMPGKGTANGRKQGTFGIC